MSNDGSYLPHRTSSRGSFSRSHACHFRIGIDVGSIVVGKVGLDVRLPGLDSEGVFVGPQIGVVAARVRIASDMAVARGSERQEIRSQRRFVGGAIRPESPTRPPRSGPRPSLWATAF